MEGDLRPQASSIDLQLHWPLLQVTGGEFIPEELAGIPM
jgi:hypothetical protein